jgi:prepilin peptidase CpaA
MHDTNVMAALVVLGTMLLAAGIDGWKLKVPNWLTFPFVLSGWAFHLWCGGFGALGFSLLGTLAGLGLLLAPYAIGGMGAGDVKLFAGVGAWMGPAVAWWSFCISAMAGGVIAMVMVAGLAWRQRSWLPVWSHAARFETVAVDLLTTHSPVELAERAAQRKPTATLLPYGIPLAVGTIAYIFWAGIL